ncbi:MAG: PhoX family protein, partial [Microcoleaceae cyanobacterium]
GKSLPMAKLEAALKSSKNAEINAFGLKADNAARQAVLKVSQEGLTDLGLGVISLRRNAEGQWERTFSKADRRVTGLSGWTDNRYLKSTGPATAVFKKKGQGYDDGLGDRIIGTFGNCAGGTTPWGTVFSGEENVQMYVADAMYPDGTSYPPSKKPFSGALEGLGNVFGLAGNKYGWMVEIDPANPEDYGTKHTWLGRYRHEAVAIRAEVGKPLIFYSGCDRRGGHLYKFVSAEAVVDPKDKANSRFLNTGMLYAAKFNADGSGEWIPLKADTPVNPDAPEVHAGGTIGLPQRPEGGDFLATTAADITKFKQQFKTLGDLYQGNTPEELQGAILIDAHLAASAAGATCTARPEDTEIGPNGAAFIAFTSGFPEEETGGPDLRVFKGPDSNMWEYGWIMRLDEENNAPDALKFRWEMFATGGEVADGGLGFSNPDNLEFDRNGNLWMVTDVSTSKTNKAVPMGRMNPKKNQPMEQPEIAGIFGNNSLWFFPTSGENAGNGYLFAMGPMECEMTGPFFTENQETLFIAVQHPGENKGTRKDMGSEKREFSLKTTNGQEFMQTRQVPMGSNWPSLRQNEPPKPAVVAIRRINSGQIV